MSAANRRRGHDWERDICAWLRERGHEAITSRSRVDGYQKGVDLITDLPVTIEAKNHKTIDLAGFVDQAVADAHGDYASVWIKRRGVSDVGGGYVVMQACDFVALVSELRTAPLSDDEVPF